MGRVCSEVQDWVEEQIEQPVEQWVNELQQSCEEQDCNWWCLCCNKWLCWLVWVIVKVVTWVIVTVGKWVTRVVCEIVTFVLDVIAFIFELIFSIPIIGGVIRTIVNWVTEIVWRIVGLVDFLASLAGIRPRKKMYCGAIVPSVDGTPIASDEEIMRQVDAAVDFYDQKCNIRLIFTGICHTNIAAPDAGLKVGCDASGFFNDWWLAGSYFEFAAANCKFTDGFRRVVGLGGEIIIFVVEEVNGATRGCSLVRPTISFS